MLVSEDSESETPAAKWLAESHGIDIRCVRGTLGASRPGGKPELQCVSVYPEPPALDRADQPREAVAMPAPPRPITHEAVALPASAEPTAADEPDIGEDLESSPVPLRRVHFTTAVALGSALALVAIALLLPDSPNAPRVSVAPVEVAAAPRPVLAGVVADEKTARPIRGAKLYYAGRRVTTALDGRFVFEQPEAGRRLFAKAAGYRRAEHRDQGTPDTLRLTPIEVRGIYLSWANPARPARLACVEELLDSGLLNTVVVGVKSPRGYLGLPVEHELARAGRSAAGAGGLAGQVRDWKRQGVYVIAHIGVFRDRALANERPDLALRSLKTDQIVRDASGTPWTDPARKPVRDYNIAVARAAAAAGFDEVQFDFVRYPASKLSAEGVRAADRGRRLENITRFLREASDALAPENVYVAATVLGSVCSMRRVSFVGQKLEEIAAEVDYVCPMLYPSSFAGSEADLIERAYPLVRENLEAAAARLGGDRKKLRPWLQNFPNPSNPKTPLSAAALRSQLNGAVDAGASGWMFWDPATRYTNALRAAAGGR